MPFTIRLDTLSGKSSITYVVSHNCAGMKTDLYDTFLLEKILTMPNIIILIKVFKTRFKNFRTPYYFLSFRGRKTKSIIKIKHRRLLFFTFVVSIFMVFLAEKLIHTINILSKFVSNSFLKNIIY